jgi:hypothetical protein
MIVSQKPSLEAVYDSLLQTRAAHSNLGGPPIAAATDAGKQQAAPKTGNASTPKSTLNVNILA